MSDIPFGDIEESKSQKQGNSTKITKVLEESKSQSQKSQKSGGSLKYIKVVEESKDQKPDQSTVKSTKSYSGKKESLDEWVNRS